MYTAYTVIIGSYDYLKPIMVPQTGDWRFICFTDQDPNGELTKLLPIGHRWEIRKVDVMECGPAKTARYIKINFHEFIEDDISIFIDGTFFINTNLSRWIRKRMRSEQFVTVFHPFDDCCYTDAFSCLSAGKGNQWDIIRQINEYREMGLPENNGLISSGILMRRKTKQTIEACKMWWEQVEKYSERDQIAFGYVNWKLPGCHTSIQWDYTKQKEFMHCPHRHKPKAEGQALRIAGIE